MIHEHENSSNRSETMEQQTDQSAQRHHDSVCECVCVPALVVRPLGSGSTTWVGGAYRA